MEKPIVYRYHDYLGYIEDMIEYRKLTGHGENMKAVGNKLGITPSYLSMVLNGKRELSRALTKKFVKYFSLPRMESDFFELLVAFNVEKDDTLRSEYLEKMKKFKKYKMYHRTDTNWHDYMSNWLHITIREMTAIKGFNDDPKWIQENLKYSASLADIKNALDFLIKEKIIIKNESGIFDKPDYDVSCTDKIYSNALAKFHREFLQLAGDSIVQSTTDERQLKGHCVAFDQKNFFYAKQILDEALDKIINLENDTEEKEAVYFMELALFPLTKSEQ